MKRYVEAWDMRGRLRRLGLAMAWLALAGAGLAGGLGKASADESFVCEDGSVVTVRPGDLEIMKRTNACVAAYYGGLEAMQPDVPLPIRKPVVLAEAVASPPAIAGEGLETGSLQDGSGSSAGEEQAAERPKGTYRRVYILNAKPGASPWYEHVQ